jgi:hypothetical protein
MINNTETNPNAATDIQELQQVARNQTQFKIWELEERLQQLKDIKAHIETVTDWDSYERLIGNVNYGDLEALTALTTLANHFQEMKQGDYF